MEKPPEDKTSLNEVWGTQETEPINPVEQCTTIDALITLLEEDALDKKVLFTSQIDEGPPHVWNNQDLITIIETVEAASSISQEEFNLALQQLPRDRGLRERVRLLLDDPWDT